MRDDNRLHDRIKIGMVILLLALAYLLPGLGLRITKDRLLDPAGYPGGAGLRRPGQKNRRRQLRGESSWWIRGTEAVIPA